MEFGGGIDICYIGATTSIIIVTIVNYLIHGINFDNVYEICKKYGFSTWDLNAFFIFNSVHIWAPLLFFFSYRDFGGRLTKFIRLYMKIGFHSTGMLTWNFDEKSNVRLLL